MSDDLISIHGLVDSDFDDPVRSFEGTFAGFETSAAQGYDGTRVELQFKDLDNVVAVTPYDLPIKTINIGSSNKNKSRWGFFANSLKQFLVAGEDIKDIIGRRITMVFCDGEDGRPDPEPIWNRRAGDNWKLSQSLKEKIAATADEAIKTEAQSELDELGPIHENGQQPTAVWKVQGVDGAVAGAAKAADASDGVSAADWAKQNIIGKTLADFNKWALADSRVRKDAALQRSIVDKTFIKSLLDLGEVVKNDDDIFQLPE